MELSTEKIHPVPCQILDQLCNLKMNTAEELLTWSEDSISV